MAKVEVLNGALTTSKAELRVLNANNTRLERINRNLDIILAVVGVFIAFLVFKK